MYDFFCICQYCGDTVIIEKKVIVDLFFAKCFGHLELIDKDFGRMVYEFRKNLSNRKKAFLNSFN